MKLALPDICFQLGWFGTWQPNSSFISAAGTRDKSTVFPIKLICEIQINVPASEVAIVNLEFWSRSLMLFGVLALVLSPLLFE